MRECFKDTKLANDEFQQTFKLEQTDIFFFFFLLLPHFLKKKKSLKSNLIK